MQDGNPASGQAPTAVAGQSPSAGRSARARLKRIRWSRLAKSTTVQLVSVVAFLLIWQAAGSNVNPILLATPTSVVQAFFDLVHKGELQGAFLTAMEDLALGYGLAIVVGIGVGLLMGWNRTVEQVLNPYINFMQATPLVAVVPLVVIWFGIEYKARVAVVFMLAVWSIIIATATGVKATPRLLHEVARVYRLNQFRIMTEISLPNAVPYIFAGLRIGLGKGLIGMVIAEMEVSVVGLGAIVQNYGQAFRTAYLLAGIITASLVGVITAGALELILARFFPWVAGTSARQE